MTPAMKAMVEAMAAEIGRQAQDDDGTQSFPAAGELQDGRLLGFDGLLDLEKVARAGLKSIREPDELMEDAAMAEEGCGCPCCVCSDDWEAMIDAILGEKP